jgi:hypothetical protein
MEESPDAAIRNVARARYRDGRIKVLTPILMFDSFRQDVLPPYRIGTGHSGIITGWIPKVAGGTSACDRRSNPNSH